MLSGILNAIYVGGLPRPRRFAARSALLVDFSSGDILYAQNADAQCPPASLTKLMTLRLVFKALRTGQIDPYSMVAIRPSADADHPAFAGASVMHLRAGDRVTLGDLLRGVAIPSGCDAAMALAEVVSGSAAAFVAKMNAEAASLGMHRTRFVDPHGLSEANQTTARDLAIFARRYIEDDPEALAQLHSLPSFTYRSRTLHATNMLLGRCDGVDGLKTGFLDAAGYHQITTAVRGVSRLIGVVLGTASRRARRDQSAALLNYGFDLLAASPVPFTYSLRDPLDGGVRSLRSQL